MAPNETLANSLLSSLDPNTTSEADLKEAFCRDIDSFSWEFNSAPQVQQRPYDTGKGSSVGSTVGSIIGIIAAVLVVFTICCVCCICCAFKGAKDKLSGAFKSSKSDEDNGVGFSPIQGTQAATTGYHPNPGYKSQPTPQHLPYELHPADPPPIPPTQPGYTNAYPPNGGTPAYPLPQQYPPAYPQENSSTFPVGNGAPYPPNNDAPYPPSNGAPYPPSNGAPYPPSGFPYHPTDQPAYNPTAPP